MTAKRIYQKTTYRLLKLLSLGLGAILSVFFGCGIIDPPAPLYGVPLAKYQITGTILSSDQNLPVKGLFVSIRDTMNASAALDSTRTDSLGKYLLHFSDAAWDSTWDLKVEDIDSIENGSFVTKDTIISMRAQKTVDLKIDRTN